MSNNPDEIRAEIDQTRLDLSRDVEALGEVVAPSNVAKRQIGKVTHVATDMKSKVMGRAEGVFGRAGGMRGSASESASELGEKAGDISTQARQKAQGSPLMMGLVALGGGWLLGSIIPVTAREKQAALRAKEMGQPVLKEKGQTVAQVAAEKLRQPAQHAAEAVKESAVSAVENVKGESQQAAQDVKSSATDAKETVQEQRTAP